ncbi:MAG: hypothetical protein RR328_05590 [Bacteroidales bacterium]
MYKTYLLLTMPKHFILYALIVGIFLCPFLSSVQAQSISPSKNELKDKSKPYQMGHYLNDRLSLKIGYKYRWGLNIELNYAFLNILEVGLYTGIDRYYADPDPDSIYRDEQGVLHAIQNTYPTESPFALLMGANLNIHILPLFIPKNRFRFDLYISNKFYTAYVFLPKDYPCERFLPFHAETGLGFSCYFTPRFGMYIEGSYQYQNGYKADLISSYKEPNTGGIGRFHGRIGFIFRLSKL